MSVGISGFNLIGWKFYSAVCLAALFALSVSGCGKQEAVIENGSQVSLKYIGTLADGTIFDQTEEGAAPFEFQAGSGQVIPGFDKAVLGMKLNEKKKFNIPAAEAYGVRNEDLFRKVPLSFFPEDVTPELEQVLQLADPNGRPMPGTIISIDEDSVGLDLNHPLAGQDLTFDIEVVAFEPPAVKTTE